MMFGRRVFRCVLFTAAAVVLAAGCGSEKSKSDIHDTGQELLGSPQAVLAKVGDKTVRLTEVDLVTMYWQQSGSPEAREAKSRKDLQLKALDYLIDRLVLAKEANRRGIVADTVRLNGMLKQWNAQFKDANDRDAKLAQRNMTYDVLRESFRQDLVVGDLIRQTVSDTLKLPEERVEQFYRDHPDYFDMEEVHARHVLVKMDPGAPPESLAAGRQLAEHVRDEARRGVDFADLAARYSDCPSKAQGGDLGFFQRARMVPAFSEAAFAMQPGQISDVVQTEFGFHVIKVEERRGEGLRPIDEVRPAIRRMLEGEAVQKAVDDWADKLRAQAKVKMMLPA